MARKATLVNSPTPYNINDAAHQIGCCPNTIRDYIKNGLLQVPRTSGGYAILFEPQIEAARKIFERNTQQMPRRQRG